MDIPDTLEIPQKALFTAALILETGPLERHNKWACQVQTAWAAARI